MYPLCYGGRSAGLHFQRHVLENPASAHLSQVLFAGSMACLNQHNQLEARHLGEYLELHSTDDSPFEDECRRRVSVYSKHLSYYRDEGAVVTALLGELYLEQANTHFHKAWDEKAVELDAHNMKNGTTGHATGHRRSL